MLHRLRRLEKRPGLLGGTRGSDHCLLFRIQDEEDEEPPGPGRAPPSLSDLDDTTTSVLGTARVSISPAGGVAAMVTCAAPLA